jgi:hypothetical protein
MGLFLADVSALCQSSLREADGNASRPPSAGRLPFRGVPIKILPASGHTALCSAVRRAGESERRNRHGALFPLRAPIWANTNSFFFPVRSQEAFAVVSRKYFDGGNTPARVSSRPTAARISSAQSAQVISLIPKCRRAA